MCLSPSGFGKSFAMGFFWLTLLPLVFDFEKIRRYKYMSVQKSKNAPDNYTALVKLYKPHTSCTNHMMMSYNSLTFH